MVEIIQRSRALLVCGLFAALGLSGCESVQLLRTADDLGTAAIQFDDIPVPRGMRLSTHRNCSHSHVVGSFRYGDFVYFGFTPEAEVVSYMQDRMTVHDWQLASSESSEMATRLRFERRPYVADCKIWRENAKTRMRIAVRTEVPGETGLTETGLTETGPVEPHSGD